MSTNLYYLRHKLYNVIEIKKAEIKLIQTNFLQAYIQDNDDLMLLYEKQYDEHCLYIKKAERIIDKINKKVGK